MTALLDWSGHVFAGLVHVSAQAVVLIVLILLAQAFFSNWLTPRWRYALWMLVVVRLLLPVTFDSSFSIFNLIRPRPPTQAMVNLPPTLADVTSPQKTRNTGIASMDGVNPADTLPSRKPQESAAAASVNQNPKISKLTWSWWTWAVLVWLVGVAILGLRIIWQNILFYKRLRWEPTVTNAAAWVVLEECRLLMSVRYRLVLVETSLAHSPALYGFLRLHLLLPEKTLAAFTPEELRYVFLHELAHVKRRDMLVNWFLTVLRVFHWFNPFVWLAFRRMATDRELAADALALNCLETQENKAYGKAIIKLLQNLLRPPLVPGVVGILEDRNQMKQRMRMIAKFSKTDRWPVLAITLFTGLGLIALTDAQTRPNKSGESGSSQPATTKVATSPVEKTNDEAAMIKKPKITLEKVKSFTGTNDIIEKSVGMFLSPNSKFLLYEGKIIPVLGGTSFGLDELHGATAIWSPDGTKIAYYKEGVQVLPISPETGRSTGPLNSLLHGKDKYFLSLKHAWAADSQSLYVMDQQQKLWKLPLNGSPCEEITEPSTMGVTSPDGKWVVYSVLKDGLWIKSIQDGTIRKLNGNTDSTALVPYFWSADSQWIVFRGEGWDSGHAMTLHISDGRRIAIEPEVSMPLVGWSAASKKLFFYGSSFRHNFVPKLAPVAGGPTVYALRSLKMGIGTFLWSPDSRPP